MAFAECNGDLYATHCIPDKPPLASSEALFCLPRFFESCTKLLFARRKLRLLACYENRTLGEPR